MKASHGSLFFARLKKPRFWPLVLAYLTVGIFLVAMEIGIDDVPDFISRDLTNTDGWDIFNAISYDVATLKKEKLAPGEPRILAVGGSMIREALNDPQYVKDMLQQQLKTPVSFAKLAGTFHKEIETLGVVSNLSIDKNTVIYVTVDALMFEHYRDAGNLHTYETLYCSSRIPFMRMDPARDFLIAHGGEDKCPLNIMRHRLSMAYFLTRRLQTHTMFTPVPSNVLHDDIPDKLSRPLPDTLFLNDNSPVPASELTHTLSPLQTDLIHEIKTYVESRGGHIVFLFMPMLVSEPDLPAFLKDAFQKGHIDYVNLDKPEFGFEAGDFDDAFHLNSNGRKKFSPIFANMVRYHLTEFGIRPPPAKKGNAL